MEELSGRQAATEESLTNKEFTKLQLLIRAVSLLHIHNLERPLSEGGVVQLQVQKEFLKVYGPRPILVNFLKLTKELLGGRF